LIHGGSIIFDRSHCVHCKQVLKWHHLIPVVSWIFLHGSCAFCSKKISFLYPFIELLTAALLTAAFFLLPHQYFLFYFLFFSSLIVTIRTDLETFLISRFVTIFFIPAAWILILLNWAPLSLNESIIGTASGYFFLASIAWIYFTCTKRVGLGQGDVELIATIGAFLGLRGWWVSLMIGSLMGSFMGLCALIFLPATTEKIKIPFGPFLALGACCYTFWGAILSHLIFGF